MASLAPVVTMIWSGANEIPQVAKKALHASRVSGRPSLGA